MSYHHSSDLMYLNDLRKTRKDSLFADYGFKDLDLSESSKRYISDKIQHRLWSCSVTIVLIGERTGDSSWIDWEIWYSLQSYKDPKVSRRSFKPKGLLALYLPVERHNVPKRLQENIDSGYAVEINWDQLGTLWDIKLEQAYKNRNHSRRIKNDIALKDDPRKLFGNISLRRLFSR